MPTPVSSFSPFTPFTPASTTHNSGGYFDRPATANIGISSPLARRPDMRNNGRRSSSFLCMSRVASASDSPNRQPCEIGWRMASRMKDEAWSAWEQQLRNLSLNTSTKINLSPKPSPPSNKANLTHDNPEGIKFDKRRTAVPESLKLSSNPPHPAHELTIPPSPCRSNCSNGLARPPKLGTPRRSFDPSSFPNQTHFNEIQHASAN